MREKIEKLLLSHVPPTMAKNIARQIVDEILTAQPESECPVCGGVMTEVRPGRWHCDCGEEIIGQLPAQTESEAEEYALAMSHARAKFKSFPTAQPESEERRLYEHRTEKYPHGVHGGDTAQLEMNKQQILDEIIKQFPYLPMVHMVLDNILTAQPESEGK